jgi:small subunit ribosomal protein S8
MSVNDPIADMLTRIRNAVMAKHTGVGMPSSKLKVAIAEILKQEGYLEGFKVNQEAGSPAPTLRLELRYVGERRGRHSVLSGLERISRPGRRVYAAKHEIPWVLSGMGLAIVSTSQGLMTDRRARKLGLGGEVVCKIW